MNTYNWQKLNNLSVGGGSSTEGRSIVTIQSGHTYLYKLISTVNLILPTIWLLNYFLFHLLSIHIYVERTDSECRLGGTSVTLNAACFEAVKKLDVWIYNSNHGMRTMNGMLEVNLNDSRFLSEQTEIIETSWDKYKLTLPIQFTCCIVILLLDAARWLVKSRLRLDYDIPIMFGMSLMLLLSALLRVLETHLYYQLLNNMTLFLRNFNSRLRRKGHHDSTNEHHHPHVDWKANGLQSSNSDGISGHIDIFCLVPANLHFTTATLGLFGVMLNIALVFDCMDPV